MFAGCAGLVKVGNFLTILIFTLNSFTVEENRQEEAYSYIFQVCGDAGGLKNAGLVQKEKDGKLVRIGNYTNTRAIKGSMLRCLTFRNDVSAFVSFLLQVDFSEPIMVFSISFQFNYIFI